MTHILEEQKFVRERYILVAAIVTVIPAGAWNIFVEKVRHQRPAPLVTTGTYEIEGT